MGLTPLNSVSAPDSPIDLRTGDDYDHVAGRFKWRCNQAGAARMLVYKGGANNTTRPLLGWHANGQRVGVEHFRHISRRRRRIDGVVGDSRRRRGERGRIRVELVPGRHRDAIDAARASRQPTQKQRRHATMELFHAVLLELCHAPCQHDDQVPVSRPTYVPTPAPITPSYKPTAAPPS